MLMKYIFDYEETRLKILEIEANSFLDACAQVKELVQDDDIVTPDDFLCAKLILPCKDNHFIVEQDGREINYKELDVTVEQW